MNNQSGNDLRIDIITQAIDAMKAEQGAGTQMVRQA